MEKTPSKSSIALALILSFVWLLSYWILLLPDPDQIGQVLDAYLSCNWSQIKTLPLTDIFLGSTKKNLFCFAFIVLFDSGVLLWIKTKKDVPWLSATIGSIVLLGLVIPLIGALHSVEGKTPESVLILLQVLYVTVLGAKFFSYLAPDKIAREIEG